MVNIYLILVYDIELTRIAKVNTLLKRYLHWRQNSVFEGELTYAQYQIMKTELHRLIDETDSILIYSVQTRNTMTSEVIGTDKNPIRTIF